jgi:hypothetical protein
MPRKRSKKSRDMVRISDVGEGSIVAAGKGAKAMVIQISNSTSLRQWWHNILREHRKYPCCAFILALPTDNQVLKYLTEFGKEIDLISNENCLVLALSDTQVTRYGVFDESLWKVAINEQVTNGQNIKIAKLLGIELTEFPCMVIFQDIRSSDHLIVSLQNMDVDEISQKMRTVFSIIQAAISKKTNPLVELKHQKQKKELQNAGQSVIGTLRSFAGKTFETAMEALVQSVVKNA